MARRVLSGAFRVPSAKSITPATPAATPPAEPAGEPIQPEIPEWVGWVDKGSQALDLLGKGKQLYSLASTAASQGAGAAMNALGASVAQAGPVIVAGLIAKKLMEPNVDNYWMRITSGDTDVVNAANDMTKLNPDQYEDLMRAQWDRWYRTEGMDSDGEDVMGRMLARNKDYSDSYQEFLGLNEGNTTGLLNLPGLPDGYGAVPTPNNEFLRDVAGISTATEYNEKDSRQSPLHEATSSFGKITLSGWNDMGDEFAEAGTMTVDLMAKLDRAIAQAVEPDQITAISEALNGLDQQSAKWSDKKAPSESLNGLLRDRYRVVAATLGEDTLARYDALTADGAMVTEAIIEMLGGEDKIKERQGGVTINAPAYVRYEAGDGVTRR